MFICTKSIWLQNSRCLIAKLALHTRGGENVNSHFLLDSNSHLPQPPQSVVRHAGKCSPMISGKLHFLSLSLPQPDGFDSNHPPVSMCNNTSGGHDVRVNYWYSTVLKEVSLAYWLRYHIITSSSLTVFPNTLEWTVSHCCGEPHLMFQLKSNKTEGILILRTPLEPCQLNRSETA